MNRADSTLSNAIIDGLPLGERLSLLKRCQRIDLEREEVLCDIRRVNKTIYFPITGYISFVAISDNHSSIGLGLIGNEGMLGASVALGVDKAPAKAVVQGEGAAWALPVAAFQQLLLSNPVLSRAVLRYNYNFMQCLVRSIICVHTHEIVARLAQWLLMTSDCAHKDDFYITHGFLAKMLGVRRSGVSIAAGNLRNRSLIHYQRGNIMLLDKKALMLTSCSCYILMKNDYEALFDAI